MPKFTVSIEMDIIAEDEVHAATLGYKALLNNPPPLHYTVTNGDGRSREIVVDRVAAEEYREADDFTIIADGILGVFKRKRDSDA